MQRITTQMTSQRMIADLTQAFDRVSAIQEQLSSGKRINQPSDDPYGAGRAIQVSGELAGLASYASNVDDGTAWAQASDSSLMGMNDIVQRVRELTVQAGNDTNDASTRADIAAEVDQLADAVKQQANSTYSGQHIFSGTLTTTTPYQTGAVDSYAGNSKTIDRQIGPGSRVQVNTDISQLLGNGQAAADNKLLNVLRDISQHLRGGSTADAAALRGQDLQHLDANMDKLAEMQANVGATINRLSLASSRIQDLQSSQTKLLSETQDADIGKDAVDYSTGQAALTAALRASANIVQSSLLDFLK